MDSWEKKRFRIEQKAKRYLYRVCEIVGATISAPIWNDVAIYTNSEHQFMVRSNSVRRTNLRTGEWEWTCVNHKKQMPAAEMVASILLVLRNDPTRFDAWMERRGFSVTSR